MMFKAVLYVDERAYEQFCNKLWHRSVFIVGMYQLTMKGCNASQFACPFVFAYSITIDTVAISSR